MNKKADNIILGISIGDLNGIGSEIILKTFEDSRILEFCTPVVFANVKVLSAMKKILQLEIPLHGIDNLSHILPGKFNVLNIWRENVDLNLGKKEEIGGSYGIKSFLAATKALKENRIDVLVTAPINKENSQSDKFNFPGHTDYLNQELDGTALMLMVHDNLRIGLLTDHIPVNQIAQKITEKLIHQKITTIEQTLVSDFAISRPKIAVLGLNPHCGDGGLIGNEDDTIIKPAIRKLFGKGTLVFGPFSADSFFGTDNYKKYDVIIAAYHDQGLIPFKTLAFGSGVNFTAGLDKIRTSPDHGTAYDIAGEGVADYNSFKEAVFLALDIYKTRSEYQELTKNVLKISPKDTQNNSEK